MDGLRELGLTKYEAAVYEALLRLGRSSAKDIAKDAAIPPTAAYPNLKALKEYGLVKQFSGDLNLFEANEPRIALDSYIDRKHHLLSKTKDTILPSLLALKEQRTEEMPDPVQLSTGFHASTTIADEMISRAKDSLYILGWGFRTSRSLYTGMKFFRKLAKTAAKNGFAPYMIFGDDNERTRMLAAECKRLNIPAKHQYMVNCSFVIVDGRECKITLKRKDLKNRINMHIVEPSLVQAFEEYAKNVWERASTF